MIHDLMRLNLKDHISFTCLSLETGAVKRLSVLIASIHQLSYFYQRLRVSGVSEALSLGAVPSLSFCILLFHGFLDRA